jgi:hypothetical protein
MRIRGEKSPVQSRAGRADGQGMAWFSRRRTAGPDPAAGGRPTPRKSGRAIAMDASSAATAIRAVLATRCPDPRSVLSFDEALELVCRASGWPVGHAWVATQDGWRTSGAWYDSGSTNPEGQDRFAGLRECTAVTDLGSGRGIVAAVLHLASCRFLPGLEGLGSSVRQREAAETGLSAVVGVPVRTDGKLTTVFEFVTLGYVEPDDALADALLEVASRSRRRAPAKKPLSPLASKLKSRLEEEFPQHLAV